MSDEDHTQEQRDENPAAPVEAPSAAAELPAPEPPPPVPPGFAPVDAAGGPPPGEAGRRAWPFALLLGFLNYPLMGALAAAASLGQGSGMEALGCLLPGVILVGELVGGIVLRNTGRPYWGKVLLLAPLFSLAGAVVVVVVFFGVCLLSGPPNFH